MRSPQEAQQHAPLDEEREREAIEAGRMELHRLFHEEHGNDARELIRDNDGQYINEKTRDVWEWCEKIIMASLAHARKQQDLVTKEISLPGGDKQQEERDHLRGTTEMIDPQGCRERFEAWEGVQETFDIPQHWAYSIAWEAWQACEAQQREERVCHDWPSLLDEIDKMAVESLSPGLCDDLRNATSWLRKTRTDCGGRVEEEE